MPGVAGTWKDLTDNVNSMATNLTGQVRNIAEVTTAVAGGDLSKKITVDVRGEILQLKRTERAFLAYCLAVPEEGERRLAEADLESSSRAYDPPRAEYLRGRVRTPAANLPPDDEPLARLVAELVIRAGQLEATPAKLELEALQLDLSRLDRLISAARVTGGAGMRDLAVRRQTVLDDIRHRLN